MFRMSDGLRQSWHDLLHVWTVEPALVERTYEEIREHYAEHGRFYHTLDHIQNVLEMVDRLGSYAQNFNTVKLAAWLHDVIYDSRATDNEERSADYALRLCQQLSIPKGQGVADLIRRTKMHDAGDDGDAQVLIDADLAILGSAESEYRTYAAKIRQEYAWVPEAEYRQGRRRVLQHFVDRPRIFHFLTQLEGQARRNLTAEMARLAVV